MKLRLSGLFTGMLLFCWIIGGCRATQTSQPKQWFENSLRRSAEADEIEQIVNIGSGCTGFFVENTSQKVFIATARHCFQYQEFDWCAKRGSFLSDAGKRGYCHRIVATDASRDIVVFEAENFDIPPSTKRFRLAAFHPAVGAELNMLGYPMDFIREGAATMTLNCKILSGIMPYAQDNTPLKDANQHHNCSTYSGNSGGPMFLEGTRDVVGMPASFRPKDYKMSTSKDVDQSAWMASMADFVRQVRPVLEAAGIVISEFPSNPIAITWQLSNEEQEFARICETLDVDSASYLTLRAMLDYVSSDNCELAAFRLHKATELVLQNQGISDLSLLQQKIFASGQLKALYLADNPLLNLQAISGLTSLRYLDLSRTAMHALPNLSQLKYLVFLKYDGNSL